MKTLFAIGAGMCGGGRGRQEKRRKDN